VIRWDEVEHGMLVRSDPGTDFVWHYVKLGEHGCTVGCHGTRPDSRANWGHMVGSELPKWSGWSADMLVTVVAEGMTGAETGAECGRCPRRTTLASRLRSLRSRLGKMICP